MVVERYNWVLEEEEGNVLLQVQPEQVSFAGRGGGNLLSWLGKSLPPLCQRRDPASVSTFT